MRKQILSLAVALLIGSTVCMAQNRQNGKADREKRMEQIVADLGLNEKQAKDFKAAIFGSFINNLFNLHDHFRSIKVECRLHLNESIFQFK